MEKLKGSSFAKISGTLETAELKETVNREAKRSFTALAIQNKNIAFQARGNKMIKATKTTKNSKKQGLQKFCIQIICCSI